MHVTSKLKMNMTNPDPSLSVNAVQGDAYSRSVSIALYNGILPWTIPEGTTAAVRYAKPDRTKGYYDTLPDGTSAWSVQENILTVWLAPQMLTVSGNVKAQIELIMGTHILSTFCLTVHVESNPAAGILKSEDYVNWLQWIQEEAKEHVLQIQQSVQAADQASLSAAQASEDAAASAVNAAISADCAKNASYQAVDAAASADASQKKAESVAADISVIVARNEAYTKTESDHRYSPSIVQTAAGEVITLSDASDTQPVNLKLFGKTFQSGTPTPEAPVPPESIGIEGSIGITICSKNLLDNRFSRWLTSGFTTDLLSDGSFKISGSNANYTGYYLLCTFMLKPGKYFLSGCPAGGSSTTYAISCEKASGGFVGYDTGNGLSITVNTEEEYSFLVRLNAGYVANNLIFYPQLEIGSTATEYKPYSGQSLSVSTPCGLPGIPVVSGGNYTDENGQQWICDEVDFAKGKYVKKIDVYSNLTFSKYADAYDVGTSSLFAYMIKTGQGTNKTKKAVLCSHVKFDDSVVAADKLGFYVAYGYIYVRIPGIKDAAEFNEKMADAVFVVESYDPTETDLTTEEIATYAALHTNYPNTTVYNDAGADMEVKYVADTKLYIDKKFDQLAIAMLNN